MTVSCVLFDLDGTVLDTVSDCKNAINRAMRDFSFPLHSDDEVRSYLNDGARMLIYRSMPEGAREDEALLETVKEHYLSYYSEECVKQSRLYDGILPMLKKLKAQGISLGIVTNKPDIQTQIMVPHYFGDLFEYYEGNTESNPVKPDKRRVDAALCALGKRREETVFVGDSHVDVATARNAGIPCIGVAWGFAGLPGFRDTPPDYIAYTPSDILNILSEINLSQKREAKTNAEGRADS